MDTFIRRRTNLACLQETRWSGKESIGIQNFGYRLRFTRKEQHKYGVGIIVDKN